jgi:hypothetical protein
MINSTSDNNDGSNAKVVLSGNEEKVFGELYSAVEVFAVKQCEESERVSFVELPKGKQTAAVVAVLLGLLGRFADINGFEGVAGEVLKLHFISAIDISKKYRE